MKIAIIALLVLTALAAGQYLVPTTTIQPYVTVPQYAAQYAPPRQNVQAQTADCDVCAKLNLIEAKVDEILRIAREQPETVPPVGSPPGTTKPIDFVKAAAVKCAGCHHADIYEQKGGGFQLFTPEGNFAKLTKRDQRKVVEMVDTGKMPPPGSGVTLTPEEKQALTGLFRAALTVPAQTVPVPAPGTTTPTTKSPTPTTTPPVEKGKVG